MSLPSEKIFLEAVTRSVMTKTILLSGRNSAAATAVIRLLAAAAVAISGNGEVAAAVVGSNCGSTL